MESTKLKTFVFAGKDPPENPHIGDIWCNGGTGNSMMVWTEDGQLKLVQFQFLRWITMIVLL